MPYAQNAATADYVETQVISLSNDTIFLTGDTNSFVTIPIINLHVTDSLSSYINDVGFITKDSIPANISFFNNDASYITSYIDSQQLGIFGDTLKLERGGQVIIPMSCCSLAAAVNSQTDSLLGVMDSLKGIGSMLETAVCRPNVITGKITAISKYSSSCGGKITSPCGYEITERGVCWNTTGSATLADNYTSDGAGTGSFVSSLTGLSPNTTYYVRAYAISGNDTVYGFDRKFSTKPLCVNFFEEKTDSVLLCGGVETYSWRNNSLTTSGVYYDSLKTAEGDCDSVYKLNLTVYSEVTDLDGNIYNTVKIGKQCWMKENLRTKHYPDGTSISESYGTLSTSVGYYYHIYNNADYDITYGLLYNWPAAMNNSNVSGARGICPQGWHIPRKTEYNTLINYVNANYNCNGYGARALASNSNWKYYGYGSQCAIGYDLSLNNETGFSAEPVGIYTNEGYQWFSEYVGFLTSSASPDYSYQYIDALYLNYDNAWMSVSAYPRKPIRKDFGHSVRCIKN